MDGYELARAIRRNEGEHRLGRTPIVALTANVMQGEPERCLAAGMDDFAAKPTTIPVLTAKLHRWLPELEWAMAEVPIASGDGTGLDGAVLEELTGGDAELAASVLDDFAETSREDLHALGAAADTRDAEQVRRLAHRIAGAARTVGAGELAAVARQIEGSSDWAAIGPLVEQVEGLLARIGV
jgi:HPt (histidine-containing phosphotransfer) domain-containing protein